MEQQQPTLRVSQQEQPGQSQEQSQVAPLECGIRWLGFVVYPAYRRLKRRNAVNFTRRFARNLDLYQAGRITFAELDASVKGWINHVRHADTWGLRAHMFRTHPVPKVKRRNNPEVVFRLLSAAASRGGARRSRAPEFRAQRDTEHS